MNGGTSDWESCGFLEKNYQNQKVQLRWEGFI